MDIVVFQRVQSVNGHAGRWTWRCDLCKTEAGGSWGYQHLAGAAAKEHKDKEHPVAKINPTRPPERVIGRLFWEKDHSSPWVSFPNITAFEQWRAAIRRARPGTKTERHLCDAIWTADSMLESVQSEPREEHVMKVGTATPGARRAERIRAQIAAMREELARLESLPVEPEVSDEAEPNVIWFLRAFGGSQAYTYAAVKAGDGLWYTTGPQSPKGYTWDQLIQWIAAEDDEAEVWHATDWVLL